MADYPYHEYRGHDPNKVGSFIRCRSNPCKLHGGSDIIAASPEEAYEKAHDNDSVNGMSDAVINAVMQSSDNKDSAPIRGKAGLNPYGTLVEYQDDVRGRVFLMSDRAYGQPVWSVCDSDGTPFHEFIKSDIDITKANRHSRTCPRGMEGSCSFNVDGVNVSVSNKEASYRFQMDNAEDKDELMNELRANGWVLDSLEGYDMSKIDRTFFYGSIHHESSSPHDNPYPDGRTLREMGVYTYDNHQSQDQWYYYKKAKAQDDEALMACANVLRKNYPELGSSPHWNESLEHDDITGRRGKKRVVSVDGYKAEFYPKKTGANGHEAFITLTDNTGESRTISDDYDDIR